MSCALGCGTYLGRHVTTTRSPSRLDLPGSPELNRLLDPAVVR